MKVIIYHERLVRVTATVPKRMKIYVCLILDSRRARCGKCGRGILLLDCDECKVCHAKIQWFYDAESGLREYQEHEFARQRFMAGVL